MKSNLLFSLFVMICVVVTGCGKIDTLPEGSDQIRNFTPQYFRYRIAVSFCDNAGNDLIAPLGDDRWKSRTDTYWKGSINPDRYDLKIELSVPWKGLRALRTTDNPSFRMEKYDKNRQSSSFFGEEYKEGEGKYYLRNTISMPTYYDISNGDDIEEMPCQDYITYKISCPTLFVDKAEHSLVAYWVEDPTVPTEWDYPLPPSQNPQCIRAVFDGKEVVVNKQIIGSEQGREYYIYFIDIVLDGNSAAK